MRHFNSKNLKNIVPDHKFKFKKYTDEIVNFESLETDALFEEDQNQKMIS